MSEMSLGHKLKRLREAAGRSRASVAAGAGVTYSYIQQLETGERKMPSARKLADLAATLGVSVDELLDDSIDVTAQGADREADPRRQLLEDIERECARLDVDTLEQVLGAIRLFAKAGQRVSR